MANVAEGKFFVSKKKKKMIENKIIIYNWSS